MPKAFPAEFRADVVAMARKREAPMRQLARDFGISESRLHRWVQQAEIDDGNQEGLSTKERDEPRELRKRTKLLEQENYILRRAAAYLGRDSLPK